MCCRNNKFSFGLGVRATELTDNPTDWTGSKISCFFSQLKGLQSALLRVFLLLGFWLCALLQPTQDLGVWVDIALAALVTSANMDYWNAHAWKARTRASNQLQVSF
jgi:hypothetical protein